MPFRLAAYESCPFCSYLSGEAECAFVVRTELVAAFMNRTQYERGGMLIVPTAHRETILDMTDEELASVYKLAKQLTRAAEVAFGAVGANVFQNNGIKANQHVPHFHTHVVPRYESSDPGKIFQARDFAVTPRDEQDHLAAAIRSAFAR